MCTELAAVHLREETAQERPVVAAAPLLVGVARADPAVAVHRVDLRRWRELCQPAAPPLGL